MHDNKCAGVDEQRTMIYLGGVGVPRDVERPSFDTREFAMVCVLWWGKIKDRGGPKVKTPTSLGRSVHVDLNRGLNIPGSSLFSTGISSRRLGFGLYEVANNPKPSLREEVPRQWGY